MENSNIEWCDHTFNPWLGCTKVSEGCHHCYAETLMDKRYGRVEWGPQGKRVRTSKANWRKPYQWNKKARAEGRRYRVFCASLADVFEDKPDQPEMNDWRADLFDMIQQTKHLDWLLLTKRPENVNRMIEQVTSFSESDMWFYTAQNVWVGTSIENRKQAWKRLPYLCQIPAAVRFLSCEPLLEPVDISIFLATGYDEPPYNDIVNWVIVGGESGPNARPMHPDWARSIRDQCQAAEIAFLFKQWGEWLPRGQHFANGSFNHPASDILGDWVGKKAAGRLLDGREWNEFPNVTGEGHVS